MAAISSIISKSLKLKMSDVPFLIINDRFHIDAPNILYFEYSGLAIPSISYAPNCTRSKLDLVFWAIYCSLTWFRKISQLLQALRHSRISLVIVQLCRSIFILQQGIVGHDIINGGLCDKPVVVEDLRLGIYYLTKYPCILNVLFCFCRPINVTQRWNRPLTGEMAKKEITEYLSTLLTTRECGKQENRTKFGGFKVSKTR
ncbi:hypothetical protein ABFS82_04G006500 [Erythranthe guttata]